MKEVEIRSVVDNPELLKKAIVQRGFVEKDMYEQHDIMFDLPNLSLFKSGTQKIRIRIEKGKAELTYKGKFEETKSVSRRTELNIPIELSQVQNFSIFLEAIGYPMSFQIKKTRHKFIKDDIQVTFDEWPIIGCLVEIEGEEEKIRNLAHEIAPEVDFRHYLLVELLQLHEKKVGKTISECVKEYEEKHNFKLGKFEQIFSS